MPTGHAHGHSENPQILISASWLQHRRCAAMLGHNASAPDCPMTSRHQARLFAKRALFQRLNASQKRGSLKAGFTLIELLITVVIIGVLSAIAIPNFINQRDQAATAAGKAEASALARKCSAAVITGSGFPTSAEITAAKNVTAIGCTSGAGSFTGGGVTFTVGSDGSISQ